jgi:hypothetical protein
MLAVMVFLVDPLFLCYCSSKCLQYCPPCGIIYTSNQLRKRGRKKERKKEIDKKRKKKIGSSNHFHDAVNLD